MTLAAPSDVTNQLYLNYLNATWKTPTEETLAHQRALLSHPPSEYLAANLYPSKTERQGSESEGSSQLIETDTDTVLYNCEVTRDSLLSDIREAARRHVPLFYTLEGSPECDDLVTKIMGELDSECQDITAALEAKAKDERLEDLIAHLGNAYRRLLCQHGQNNEANSTYGEMVPSRKHSRGSVPIDSESGGLPRPDVLVLNSGAVLDEPGWSYGRSSNDWPMLTSFIEVKRTAGYDYSTEYWGPLYCSLRYTRWIRATSPMRSHLHFVTWCGPLVRLWYMDAAHFGCSPAYSIKCQQDRIHIGRIFFLLTNPKCRNLLSARWMPEKDPPSELASGKALPHWKEPFAFGCTRSRPFGSQTTLWLTKPADIENSGSSRRVFLKATWLKPHLLNYELEMQERLSGLPHTPRPFGRVLLPPSIIRGSTSDHQHEDSESCLLLSVILYEHRLGRMVHSKDPESCLAELHAQFASQMLDYARLGLHYRDLNGGNFLVENGTSNVLVLADHGNMREKLRPRGSLQHKVRDLLQRAQGDTKSTHVFFQPTSLGRLSCDRLTWKFVWRSFDSIDDGPERATTLLLDLRKRLRGVLVNSHRYIDDLESAAYLHFWQMADRSSGDSRKDYELKKIFSSTFEKGNMWEYSCIWSNLLSDHCPNASETWTESMERLRRIIYTAQGRVHEEIGAIFDAENSEEQVKNRLEKALSSTQLTMDNAEEIIEGVFETRQVLIKTEDVLEVEVECFRACEEELRSTARKLEVEEREAKEKKKAEQEKAEEEEEEKKKEKEKEEEKKKEKETEEEKREEEKKEEKTMEEEKKEEEKKEEEKKEEEKKEEATRAAEMKANEAKAETKEEETKKEDMMDLT